MVLWMAWCITFVLGVFTRALGHCLLRHVHAVFLRCVHAGLLWRKPRHVHAGLLWYELRHVHAGLLKREYLHNSLIHCLIISFFQTFVLSFLMFFFLYVFLSFFPCDPASIVLFSLLYFLDASPDHYEYDRLCPSIGVRLSVRGIFFSFA